MEKKKNMDKNLKRFEDFDMLEIDENASEREEAMKLFKLNNKGE